MLGLGSNLFRSPHVGFPNQYSLNFDGSDSYVGCGNGSDVKFADADFTISAWSFNIVVILESYCSP